MAQQQLLVSCSHPPRSSTPIWSLSTSNNQPHSYAGTLYTPWHFESTLICRRAAALQGGASTMDREPLRDAYVMRASMSSFPDENTSVSSGFQDLAQAFSSRITELQQIMCLRIEGAYVSALSPLLWRSGLPVCARACCSRPALARRSHALAARRPREAAVCGGPAGPGGECTLVSGCHHCNRLRLGWDRALRALQQAHAPHEHKRRAGLAPPQASVRALEKVYKEIKEHLAREAASIPKVQSTLHSAKYE